MGEAIEMGDKPAPIPLPNSEQFYLNSAEGAKYLIQISWPLGWKEDTSLAHGSFPLM